MDDDEIKQRLQLTAAAPQLLMALVNTLGWLAENDIDPPEPILDQIESALDAAGVTK